MKTLEFNELLNNANDLESVMNLRNKVTAPAYIAKCKQKAMKVKGDYAAYLIPMQTFKKYTNKTDCGCRFSFNIPLNARGNFKDLAGLSVKGYVIAKEGGRFSKAFILLKSI